MAANAIVRVYEQDTRVILPASEFVGSLVQSAIGARDDAAASATEAAASATTAGAERAAIEAAIAGYPNGAALTIPVASRAILAGVASPAGGAYLFEAGREGHFAWSAADHSADVTADPDQAIFVAPSSDATGASGAWVRTDKVLRPTMFGAGTGAADDTAAIARALYMAARLKRPIESSDTIALRLAGDIYAGSVTAAAPAAGTLDGFRMLGKWRFLVTASASAATIYLTNAHDVRLGDVEFNLAEAPFGLGTIRTDAVRLFRAGSISKIGVDLATGNAYPTVTAGGPPLWLAAGTDDVEVAACICDFAGTRSAGVVTMVATNVRIGYVRCKGGQEAVDLAGSRDVIIDQAHGEDLTDEVIDAGNSQNVYVQRVTGERLRHVVNLKTEVVVGAPSIGTNNFRCDNIDVVDWTGTILNMPNAATANLPAAERQTLHDVSIGSIRGRTTVATTDSRVLHISPGDNAVVTRGLNIGYINAEMNAGAFANIGAMTDYRIGVVRCTAPGGISPISTGSQVTDANGRWEDVIVNGDCTLNHGHTFYNVRTRSGKILLNDAPGARGALRSDESQGDGVEILFAEKTVATVDKNVDLKVHSRNNSLAAGTHYGLRVRQGSTTDPAALVENVSIELLVDDTQGTPTSHGLALVGNFDYCRLHRSRFRNTVSAGAQGFTGLNSRNDPANQLVSSFATTASTAFTIGMNHQFRTYQLTSNATITIPADATTAIPVGSYVDLVGTHASGFTVAAADGVTIHAPLLTVPLNTPARIRKVDANRWVLERTSAA